MSHVYGFSEDEFKAMRERAVEMKKIGKVKLVMLGGQRENDDEVEEVKKFISDLDVEVKLDKAGAHMTLCFSRCLIVFFFASCMAFRIIFFTLF